MDNISENQYCADLRHRNGERAAERGTPNGGSNWLEEKDAWSARGTFKINFILYRKVHFVEREKC